MIYLTVGYKKCELFPRLVADPVLSILLPVSVIPICSLCSSCAYDDDGLNLTKDVHGLSKGRIVLPVVQPKMRTGCLKAGKVYVSRVG